jgi:hypothetical protein
MKSHFVGELICKGESVIERFCMDPVRDVAYLEIFTLSREEELWAEETVGVV